MDQARVRCAMPHVLRVVGAARLLGLGARGVGKGAVLHHLEARDPVHVVGKVAEDGRRVAAALVLRFDLLDRGLGIARHHRLEQVDDARAVHEAQHGGDVRRLHLALAIGDGLVEQRQPVAHRAFGGARDHGQRIGLGLDTFLHGDVGVVRGEQCRIQPLQVEALAARQDGDGNLVDLGRGEDELHMRRRLFQRLQQAR